MAGNKLTLELDSSPNKLIKATLLAWMDLPVEWADRDRYVADNPAEDAPAQLTLDDALKVNAIPPTGEILGARCGGCQCPASVQWRRLRRLRQSRLARTTQRTRTTRTAWTRSSTTRRRRGSRRMLDPEALRSREIGDDPYRPTRPARKPPTV